MLLVCSVWRFDRTKNTLVAVLNDAYVGLDFIKTKPLEKMKYYYLFCYPYCEGENV